jgi:hypothetical protein
MYTIRGVRGLGIRMLTLDTKTSLSRGSGAGSTDDPGTRQKLGGTQVCDQLSCRSNGSINYTARTDVRLFVSLNKGRVDGH